MTERAGYDEPSERGRLLRWLDPGPEPVRVLDARHAGALVPTEAAAVAAVDEQLPLRIAGRW